MTIGVVIGSGALMARPYDGRLVQLRHQIDALSQLGHEVLQLNPWSPESLRRLDVLHIFEGGFGNPVGIWGRPEVPRIVLAPFLDTNAFMPFYRLLAHLGSRTRRCMTPQGVLHRQAAIADAVIARSADEARILHLGIGVPRPKIWTVLNGVEPPSPATPHPAHAQDICAALNLPRPFVFMVGALQQPRKNVVRLIRATQRVGIHLVLAGDRQLPPAALPVPRHVTLLGPIDESTKTALYRACQAFCLPSLYEGTGLAALEAAVHGANIVITERGGTRDYFGNHAFYVNPFSTRSIARALHLALNSPPNTGLRDRLLSQFTWRHSAQALLHAYLGQRPPPTPPAATE